MSGPTDRVEATNIVVTMAGLGTRFRDAGYLKPKYQIEAHGRPLFDWAVASVLGQLSSTSMMVFVALEGSGIEEFVHERTAAMGIGEGRVHLVTMPETSRGQAASAMAAESLLGQTDRPFAIYNIDTHIRAGTLPLPPQGCAGWLPCFYVEEGDHWSFVASDSHGRVFAVAEKERISDMATIGYYWFRSFEVFTNAYRRWYGDRTDEIEEYVAPIYNQLIAEGLPVRASVLPSGAVVPLGTPQELRSFEMQPQGAVDLDLQL